MYVTTKHLARGKDKANEGGDAEETAWAEKCNGGKERREVEGEWQKTGDKKKAMKRKWKGSGRKGKASNNEPFEF